MDPHMKYDPSVLGGKGCSSAGVAGKKDSTANERISHEPFRGSKTAEEFIDPASRGARPGLD